MDAKVLLCMCTQGNYKINIISASLHSLATMQQFDICMVYEI